MVEISREEIMGQLKQWGCNQLDELEKNLERKLTDKELRNMLIYLMGYYDFSNNETYGLLVRNLGLDDSLSKEEFDKIKDIEL